MQGTGGNLLSRSLSLADNTISYLPDNLSAQQPQLRLTANEKFELYNNWDSKDWTTTEKSIAIWYHHGKQDFVNYQNSNLWLIDQFHPDAWLNENDKKILWETDQVWEHIILITWKKESFEQIKNLARLKRTDLNHAQQLPTEIKAYQNYYQCHKGLTIAWEDMLDEQMYTKEVQRLSTVLNLQIDVELVRKLWQNWQQSTFALLNNERP